MALKGPCLTARTREVFIRNMAAVSTFIVVFYIIGRWRPFFEVRRCAQCPVVLPWLDAMEHGWRSSYDGASSPGQTARPIKSQTISVGRWGLLRGGVRLLTGLEVGLGVY